MTGLTFDIFGRDVSASKALSSVEGKSQHSASTIGEHFKQLGAVIGAAFAGEKIIEFGKTAVDAAEAAQKTSAQTEAVLKSTKDASGQTAAGIDALAHTIGGYAGMTDEAVHAGENMLLTFQNVRNEAGKGNDIFTQAAKSATDLSVAMKIPLTNAMKLVGRAVNDPVKGLSALTRYGVSFTKQQKAQITTMVQTGHTMQAQKFILGQLNDKFAGSAAAQATPAEKAKAAWGNLTVALGTQLLPVIDKLATFITERIIPAISTMAKWLGKNVGWVLPLASAIIAVAVALKLYAMWQAIANVVSKANVWVLLAVAIIALGVALVVAYKHSKTFREIVQSAFHVVADAGKFMWGILKFIFEAWKVQINIVRNVVVGVAHGISAAFHGIASALGTAWRSISGFFDRIASGAAHLGTAIWHGIKSGVSQVANLGKEMYNAIASTIDRDLIDKIKNWHFTIGAFGIHHTFQPFGSIPDIPLMASGGIVPATPGGRLVRVAEAGRAEAIVPLGAGGMGTHVTVNFNGATMNDPVAVGRQVVRALEYAANAGVKAHIGKAIV